ncbi:MAG: redoxin domain-containing protein [Turneriella sp.]
MLYVNIMRMFFCTAVLFLPSACSNLMPDGRDLRSENSTGRGGLSVGDKAPDFTLTDSDGNAGNLYTTLSGRPGVVIYFTMWCSICTAHTDEMLTTAMVQFPTTKFLLVDYVSGSVQDMRTLKTSSGYDGTGYTVLSDGNQAVMNSYAGTMGFTVVIDSNRTIRMNEEYKKTRLLAVLGGL